MRVARVRRLDLSQSAQTDELQRNSQHQGRSCPFWTGLSLKRWFRFWDREHPTRSCVFRLASDWPNIIKFLANVWGARELGCFQGWKELSLAELAELMSVTTRTAAEVRTETIEQVGVLMPSRPNKPGSAKGRSAELITPRSQIEACAWLARLLDLTLHS